MNHLIGFLAVNLAVKTAYAKSSRMGIGLEEAENAIWEGD